MAPIDRRIWLYWEGVMPAYLGLCIESIRCTNPDADVVLLDREGFNALFTSDCDIDLDRLTPVKRSDFVRAYLLMRFGGMYIDVDCVGLLPLEPIFRAAERTGFAVVHQDDGELQTNFMVSLPEGPVVTALYEGICRTLREGKPLAWLDLATVPLLPAIAAHESTVTLLPTHWVCPVHWSEPERFLERSSDAEHASKLVDEALCYMLSNDTISSRDHTRGLKSMSREEILRENYFLSYLFRRAIAFSTRPPMHMSSQTDTMLAEFARLADIIEARVDALTELLCEVESYETIENEIWKSMDALRNAHLEVQWFDRRMERAAAFLPLNLPLYSLILFGVIPSAVSRCLHVRAPARLADIMSRVCKILDLGEVFPSVVVSTASREAFVAAHASQADLVIFTGKLANAQKLKTQLKRDVLFLFSGRGINPVVIAEDADIASAVEMTARVKLFNSGQDCAAPDCIFVHASKSRELLEGLKTVLSDLRIGDYADPNVRVGPLLEAEHLVVVAKHLSDHRDAIAFGGRIDVMRGIVEPSVIFYPRFSRTNTTEFFSPVFFVTEYSLEKDLEQYFETPQYRQNAMYVSLFGSSRYLDEQRHSIVLRETIVNDAERGNVEFGGYSVGASFVQYGKELRAQPILVSREVSTYIMWQDRLAECEGQPGGVAMQTRGGFTIYRARGPLPGPQLLVVGTTGGEVAGAYACHRLLHELRSKKTRVDAGELILVLSIPGATEWPSPLADSTLEGLVADADHTVVLRSVSMSGHPFVVGGDPRDEALAESLGLDSIVTDPGAASTRRQVVVQCGDDRDPHTSNVGFDVILNAARYLGVVGGKSRRADVIHRYAAEIPFARLVPKPVSTVRRTVVPISERLAGGARGAP
jgi:acyl-CoA reductase-like NAD-dependent aldehyde dehydrogenase